MQTYKIKNGRNIPLRGKADETLETAPPSRSFALKPGDFKGVRPRLLVKPGDSVKAGSPLFCDKKRENLLFCAPIAGSVNAINYGERRSIESIVITPSSTPDSEKFPSYTQAQIPEIGRENLIEQLLKGGVWPFIRQRPFSQIADPTKTPSSIFVNGMDTAPLAANPELAVQEKTREYRAGMEALKLLGHVHVTSVKPKGVLFDLTGVEKHQFTGPHPAGLVSTHISRIDPILNHGKIVWYLNARDVIHIGSFLLSGRFPSERLVAVAGSGVSHRVYYKTHIGVSAGDLVERYLNPGEQRIISGNVLTGTKIGVDGHLGFYDDLITVIPEGRERDFIGWALPGFGRHSFSRTVITSLIPTKQFRFNTNKNGEPRAFVVNGEFYEKFMALDILPDFLVKAILTEDIDQMEELGILECDPDDFALCAYACPSKIEFTEIISRGLELMEKEMG